MRKLKRILLFVCCVIMLGNVMGCGFRGDNEKDVKTINVAYQYGLAYSPAIIVKHNKLIEKYYTELTGENVSVTWTQMNSGADINVAIASGSIDIGFLGIGPAISGISSGVGYKIFTNISGQEHGIMTSDKSIDSLKDLVNTDKQIAIVNIGSIQHIILAKALKQSGLDAHALDSNIVSMKHPDGMVAVQSGAVDCHLTTSPYIFLEREDESLYELNGLEEVWSKENSFIVGVASKEVNGDAMLYEAVCKAFGESISMINEDVEKAATITCEYNGNSVEDEIVYMQKGTYAVDTSGIFEMAVFMAEEGFIDKMPVKYEDFVYENVKGD